MIRGGIVSQSMWRMWSKSFTPPIAAARFVLSDNGESLLATDATELAVPARRGAGKHLPAPVDEKGMPTGAGVVSKLTNTMDAAAWTRQASAKKVLGEMAVSP